jgi:type II secretory pathway component PulM
MTDADLLSGILVAHYAAIALFFARFWLKSRDRLFLMFSGAFVLLAIQRLAIALTQEILEQQAPLYLLRLAAFVVIIVAIIDKNRR